MTSQPFELLVSIDRDDARRLGAQIEEQFRLAIRAGTLRRGTRIPSTRDLARQLGVSRPIVMDAYAQLAAEGYLTLSHGSRPRVSASVAGGKIPAAQPADVKRPPRFDFMPAVPDLSSFPRAGWLRAAREALGGMSDEDFGYADAHGCEVLRVALVEYLGRARGVVAEPAQVIVTSGYAQGRVLACRALKASGAKRIAVEDPSYSEWEAVTDAGLEMIPVPLDDDGIQVSVLETTTADAVMLTPSHQFPTGVALSGERRTAVLSWLRSSRAIAIEDDYDAEYRYDRTPVGALQALEPDAIIYAGTASKTLAPALRLGWLVVPHHLADAVRSEQRRADFGCPRIDQHTLARFISSGELDRHLRRMRVRYRSRRDALVDALSTELPEAQVCGIAAGLHATVRLPEGHDEKRHPRGCTPAGDSVRHPG
ncbi:MAG TPA: PLP-dependent aminotransferase family protein [Gemmatimonadaceae bacterium]|nr:PLP-dependent aminotransferase family protein [Gemmatimonadaceae bacterium]